MNIFLPIIRADFELVETYEYAPGAPLSCSITGYGGLQDGDVPIESVHAWKQQTSSDFVARMFPGDHFFIHNPGFCAIIAKDLANLVLKCRSALKQG